MNRLKFILRNCEELVAGTGLIVTIAAVAFNVCMRYFFARSQNWAEEIASFGFSWTVFVGAALVYKRKSHIGIDVFVNLLPIRIRSFAADATNAFLIVLNLYLTYLSIVFAVSAWGKPTAVLYIPYTFVDLSASVGFSLMTIHSARIFLQGLKSRYATAEKGA